MPSEQQLSSYQGFCENHQAEDFNADREQTGERTGRGAEDATLSFLKYDIWKTLTLMSVFIL